MKDLMKVIKEGRILLADGAIGTMLQQKSIKELDCPEYINIYNPEILEEISLAYLKAGAKIIQTNTFGASPMRLSLFGLENKLEEINKEAVRVVKKVVKNQAYILVSIGPTGKILKPYGETSPEEIYENYFKQMKIFSSEDVDVICIETMINLSEAKLAVQAAKDALPHLPIITTMTFEETNKGFYTVYGDSILKSIRELESLGVDIIGSNCGNGIDVMIKIAKEFKKLTNKALIFQPNAGIPQLKEIGEIEYPDTPEYMRLRIKELIEMKVSIIGGCCGTTPKHIEAFNDVLTNHAAS